MSPASCTDQSFHFIRPPCIIRSHGHSGSQCVFSVHAYLTAQLQHHNHNDLSILLFSVIILTVGLTSSAQSLYILNDFAADMLLVGIVILCLMIV